MEWITLLIESGIKTYVGEKLGGEVQKHALKAKGIAVQTGFVIFGALVFMILFLSAIVMVFVDLGNQFEAHAGLHFSGLMLSSIYLTCLGIFVGGVCLIFAKLSAFKELKKVEESQSLAPDPMVLVMTFVEEFLKQLAEKLKEPKHSEE